MTRNRQLAAGLGLAIASAACWAGGNVLTRWTAARLPLSTLDVVILKALVAAAFLAGIAFCAPKLPSVPQRSRGEFLWASLFKGLNTYLWILAVTVIPAGMVAALENLQVVWVALFLALFGRQPLPAGWFVGALAAGCGVALIGRLSSIHWSELGSFILGLGSGVMFAGFLIIWNASERQTAGVRERALEMAALLLCAATLVCPAHWIWSAIRGDRLAWPLMEVGWFDGTLQALNGLVGTAVTYFFLTEATALLSRTGRASGVLLAFGLSLAVPFTLVMEWLFLGLSVDAAQWSGLGLFVIGFVLVRSGSGTSATPDPDTHR